MIQVVEVQDQRQMDIQVGTSMPFEEIIASIGLAFSLIKKERRNEIPQPDVIKMKNIIQDLEDLRQKYMNV